MSLIDFRKEAWGLENVLFNVQPPKLPYRSEVFAAREQEFNSAEMSLWDGQNLLVSGLFGIGKTIFIEELVHSLNEKYENDILAIYECLDSTETDFLTTILRGLANALKEEDDEAKQIHQLLVGVELTSQTSQKGSGGVEVSVPNIAKLAKGNESITTETLARRIVPNAAYPNAAYQIRRLIDRARVNLPHRQLVVAIDDMDKRDPERVREILIEARSTLHTSCAFVLTGHPLGILRNLYSTAGAVFGAEKQLAPLSPEAMQTLMLNYLKAGRLPGVPQSGLEPFTEEAVQIIIRHSFGIPRLMNLICSSILREAAELRCPTVDMATLRECWKGVEVKLRQMMTEETAHLLEIVTEGLDTQNVPDSMYQSLGVNSHQELMEKINMALRGDWIVGIESKHTTRFLPQPLLTDLPEQEGEQNL